MSVMVAPDCQGWRGGVDARSGVVGGLRRRFRGRRPRDSSSLRHAAPDMACAHDARITKILDPTDHRYSAMNAPAPFFLKIDGHCPICEKDTSFVAKSSWLRGSLFCTTCENGSTPRERAFALVLDEVAPYWRSADMHESSPMNRGISAKMHKQASKLVRSQYYPDIPFGTIHEGFRNEDIQDMTFPDRSFDLFVSLDVMEHIPNPEKAFAEIHRTLRPGGLMISTFPVRKDQVTGMQRRVTYNADGTVTHLKKPEYHGNPVSDDGSLVTVDYGYDIHQLIAKWAPFDVRVYRFCDERHGILGEYTDVFVCRRR